MSRPPERKIVVPNYTGSGKPHADQLRDQADMILELMRVHANDPRQYKAYAESFKILRDLLKEELTTEKRKDEAPVDLSRFDP